MKKIIIILILLSTFILKADNNNFKSIKTDIFGERVCFQKTWFDNNEYIMIYRNTNSSVQIINKTKQDLEIELLKLQIKEQIKESKNKVK